MIAAEKKVPGFYQKPETNKKQVNYNRIAIKSAIQKKNIELFKNFNPDEDIEEPEPEECPEMLCPVCKGKLYLVSYNPTGKPGDTVEWWEDEHYSTKEKLFSEMTPGEVLDRIDEIPFENSDLSDCLSPVAKQTCYQIYKRIEEAA